MTYRSTAKPAHAKPEKVPSTSEVEKAGYIPDSKRIEEMMNAGMRLEGVRREFYQVPPGSKEEPELDPLREPGLDIVDVQRFHDRKLRAMLDKAKAKKAEAAKAAADKAAASLPAPAPTGGK